MTENEMKGGQGRANFSGSVPPTMKQIIKSLFGTNRQQGSEMGAAFADIATTIRDEDEPFTESDDAEAEEVETYVPFVLETTEAEGGILSYRVSSLPEILESDGYLQTRDGRGGGPSWTELVRGALHLSGQAEVLNDLCFMSTDEQFVAETLNAADAAAVAGIAQAMHWDRAMMDAALDWAQKQGFWV